MKYECMVRLSLLWGVGGNLWARRVYSTRGSSLISPVMFTLVLVRLSPAKVCMHPRINAVNLTMHSHLDLAPRVARSWP